MMKKPASLLCLVLLALTASALLCSCAKPSYDVSVAETEKVVLYDITASEYTYDLLENNEIRITSFKGRTAELVIPSHIGGKAVTAIGTKAFVNLDFLRSAVIPDGVRSVGAYSFAGCTGMTSVTVPETVLAIGEGAFADCTRLANLILPDAVTEIPARLVSGCVRISVFNLPEGTVSIGENAFFGCKSLTGLIIPKSVTEIGKGAVGNCESFSWLTYRGSADDWGKISLSPGWDRGCGEFDINCVG